MSLGSSLSRVGLGLAIGLGLLCHCSVTLLYLSLIWGRLARLLGQTKRLSRRWSVLLRLRARGLLGLLLGWLLLGLLLRLWLLRRLRLGSW